MQQTIPPYYRKYIRIGLLAALLVSTVPFFLLCLYIHPQGDDYLYNLVLAGRNIIETLVYRYNNWTGRYSESLLSLIMAGGFNCIYIYRLYAAILIFLFPFALYVLIYRVMNGSTTVKNTAFAALLLFTVFLFNAPELSTLFYYVSCAYNASMGSLLFIVLLSVLLHILQTEKPGKRNRLTIAGCVLSAIIGGFYEPVYFMSFTALSITCLILLFKRDINLKYFFMVTLVLVMAILVSATAPGNRVRGGAALLQHGHSGLLQISIASVTHACVLVLQLLQNPLLLLSTLLFIPIAYRLYNTDIVIKKYLSVHPAIPFLSLFILATVGSFPCVWSLGLIPERVDNQVMLFLLINWFVFVQTAVNLLARKNITVLTNKNIVHIAQALIILSLLPLKYNEKIRAAEHDLVSRAPLYNKKWHERVALVNKMVSSGQRDITIPPLMDKWQDYPLTIYWGSAEIKKNPKKIFNRYYARYLGIDSVRASSSFYDELNN